MTAALRQRRDYRPSSRKVISLQDVEQSQSIADQLRQRRQPDGLRSRSAVQRPKPQSRPTAAVSDLPRARSIPLWLRLLIGVQQGSSALTLTLVGSVLAVYGWTVYIQDSWGNAYQRLQTLEDQERQLLTSYEVLKNKMALDSEDPKLGMVLPSPDQLLFLQPAPPRDSLVVSPTAEPVPRQPTFTAPLGY